MLIYRTIRARLPSCWQLAVETNMSDNYCYRYCKRRAIIHFLRPVKVVLERQILGFHMEYFIIKKEINEKKNIKNKTAILNENDGQRFCLEKLFHGKVYFGQFEPSKGLKANAGVNIVFNSEL